MQEAEGVVGMGEEQEQYASTVQVFFPNAYERRKAAELGADVLPDVTAGNTVEGSSMVLDTPAKWPSRMPPPIAGTPLSLFPHLAQLK